MVELMPFGKYKGKSVEQVVFKDYKYFTWLFDKVTKPSVRNRMDLVDHVVNNFVSVLPCKMDQCDDPAKLISIYNNYHMNYRGSSTNFIYCSPEHFSIDGAVTDNPGKARLSHLKLKTAFSSTKFDTNELVKIITECMGIKKGRKTKEYLEEFIDQVTLSKPYNF